jgi:hypothetical protein
MTGASGSTPRSKALFPLIVSLTFALVVSGAPLCRAQDAPAPSTSDSQNQNSTQKRSDSSTQPTGEDRMFGIMPAYGMVEAGRQPPPLKSGQKFKLAVQYLNPYTVFFVAVEAGVNQARNSPSDYGQGAEGYAKRYGAGFADGLSDGLFVTGVYPSLLHQDPRYYRLNNGGFAHRFGYAATRILVTRQDSGRKAFNFSEVLGSFSSSALAMTYYPDSHRNISDVSERAGIQFAFDAGFNVLKEFYPDIERIFFHKKRRH